MRLLHRLRPTRATSNPKCVLFLDVDGVLNSIESRADGNDLPTPPLLANLKRIVSVTGAALVLSSTWQLETANVARLSAALLTVGLSLAGATDDLEQCCRGDRVDEIRAWLRERGRESLAWVAVDDMDLLAMNPTRIDVQHFVRTDDQVGLTGCKADEAIEKLEGQDRS